MERLKYLYDNLERYFLISSLFIMFVLIITQVFMRYIMQSSLPWSEELVRWIFVWFIWVGISYGFKTRKHISVTVIVDKIPLKYKKIVQILFQVLMLIFFVRLAYLGYGQASSPFISKQKSLVLYWFIGDEKVSMFWLYISMVIGSALSAIRLLESILLDIHSLRGFDKNQAEELI
ncbi:TRAP transporter small permease [Photobacterium sp. DNB23_23_1]